jgi:hypothetical protein
MTTTAELVQKPGTAGALSGRVAGFGGALFVACVIIQNIVHGGIAPQTNASAAEVMHYFATHRGVEWMSACLFPIGGIGLALFAGGLCARAFSAGVRARAWSVVGALGVASIIALFSSMVATEIALLVSAHRSSTVSSTIAVLWTLHNSIFSVLLFSIAVGLLGLSRAAVNADIAPSWIGTMGTVGTALLAICAALAPAVAASTSPVLGIGALGFVMWIVMIAVVASRMARADNALRS